MIRKTNFDEYLEEQLKDPQFRERFARAGEGWDQVADAAPEFTSRSKELPLDAGGRNKPGEEKRAQLGRK